MEEQRLVPEPTTAREVLRILRNFMQRPVNNFNNEQMKLWEVLTGLRGPDVDALRDTLKDATTGVIRAAVFGGSSLQEVGAMANEDNLTLLDLRKAAANDNESAQINYHFFSHARRAFTALGLEWYSVNIVGKKGIL